MKWTDATNYSRNDTERNPDSWELKTSELRIWVSTGHIYQPGEWVYTCYAVGVDAKSLNLPKDATPEHAQERALKWVRARLQKMIDSLSSDKQ